MRKVIFYETAGGKCPAADFLDALPGKQAQKISWVLQLIEELEIVPSVCLKKLINTDEIWEVRAAAGSDIFRLLCFFDGQQLVVVAHAFQKKTQKTPKQDIKKSGRAQKGLFQENKAMKDLKSYIEERKARDLDFAQGYDSGYLEFKIGAMLRAAREEAGMTQEQLAQKLHTKKAAVSRIENHAEDIKLSTLARFAQAFGRKLRIEVV